MKKEEVTKSMETKENESGYLQPCHSRLYRESRNRDSESGRSMVEMLGVLAIMGVLAIGGIAGYRWAMDKYNANEILNEVRKRAVTASQQRILGQTINLSEYGNNTIQGHRVTSADNYKGDSNFFTITVEGIEKDICDKIIKEKIPFAVEEKVGEVVVGDDTTCAGENSNTITFAFANTLDSGATPSEPEPVEPTCRANEYLLPDGTCKADEKCSDPNYFWNSGINECTLCLTSGGVETTGSNIEDTCAKCPGVQQFQTELATSCVYCPDGIACGLECCGTRQACDFANRTCVPAACQQDSDCSGSTPLCDTVTGECFAGCKTNDDCKGANEFCDLDVDTTDNSCTQKPGQGTCKSARYTEVGDTKWIKSVAWMNWWSAENFCKANNQTLIDLSKQCRNWSEIKAAGYGTCAELNRIESDWNYYWTKHMQNSYDAFLVNLGNGYVDNAGRVYTCYALCEKES